MGKATREAKRERNEELTAHATWLALQMPVLKFLARYTDGCSLYVPLPEGEWKPGFIYHKVARAILVPFTCDKDVTIPAGWRRIVILADKGKPVACTIGDPDSKGTANKYMLDVGEGMEIMLPGNRIAKLERSGPTWSVREPDGA